ncbi:PspC domain-containing protein [Winogradskyella sp. SYSU M77433]|uniref:PspC domain-containing protein n=1 Tax=Winogradskyella sp. SYSU M77433 TaxID=3042722 RepID=UPI00248051CC|nr:PspC domain-containing protein [Winogradskyella sp. SYSU M77433]MDH7912880.1 PspC domain-containing protein [Winogradskyella sp. SYSU M77433]
MNKTVNINLAGIFFHIDEDAYLKLSRYLEAIKRSFTDSQGRSEIISDIEARIAELFSERIQNEKQVVGIKLVDEVIEIMGQPEDYLVDDEIFEDEPQPKHRQSSKPNKKLYRDTDNSYIGGVAAGLGHYFGIDSIWIRLIWLLFAIGSGGTFIVIYLIFWALVPEAKTTAEKLTMTGDPVNISNIEKKIKDSIDSVSETVKKVDLKKHGDHIKETFDSVSDNISETVRSVDFQKQGSKLKSSSQTFFDTIGNILMFFLKVIAKFIGVILIITGISALISLIVAFFTVGITDAIHFPGMDLLNVANAANIPIWLMSLLLFFAFGIPFFFVFYLGLKILVNNLKSIGNVAKFTLLGLWLMALIGIIIVVAKQASEHAIDTKINVKNELNITAKDTLNLTTVFTDDLNSYYYSDGNFRIIEDESGKSLIYTSVRFLVRSTKDSVASIIIEKEASGSSYEVAKKRANDINYSYSFSNKTLKLNRYLTTDITNKFSEQNVLVMIDLPEGSTLITDKNLNGYYGRILSKIKKGHYYKILSDDILCLDCEDDDKDDDNEEEDDDDDENEKEQKHDITVQVNENGVDIEVNDNSDN